MERNNSIEFFRFLFMIVICMWHFNMFEVFSHGYLAVEFFFILSGFFIYKSYITHPERGTLDFLLLRFKRFFPEFLLLLLITFSVKSFKYLSVTNSFGENFTWIINLFDDVLFLFSTGPFTNGVINPTWYMSVLIWGGSWLYAMLRYDSRLALNILFPLLMVVFGGYIRSKGGNIELWFTDNKFFLPLVRGMVEMSIGIYLCIFFNSKKDIINKSYSNIVNIMSIFSLINLLILLFIDVYLDIFSILFIPFIILGCLIEKSWFYKLFKHKIWGTLGGITYEMLLIHWCILMLFRFFIDKFDLSYYVLFSLEILYLLLVIIFSFILKRIYVRKLKTMF